MKLTFIILFLSFSCANLKTIVYKNKNTKAEVNKEMATVYFMKNQSLAGVNFILYDHDYPIGIIKKLSYIYVPMKSGEHSFNYSDAFKKGSINLNVKLEKGKTYFILLEDFRNGTYTMGTSSLTSYNNQTVIQQLKLIPENEALNLLSTLDEIDLEANKELWMKK